jgi:hypothetical protein
MEKSNKEIARAIAEIVYDIQSEGDFFYEHLRDEYDIVDKFAEKIFADEDHKEVMISMMSADVLSDIIIDPKGFHIKHSSEDFEDGVGYHPDDLEYDHRMTEYIRQVYENSDVSTKIMDEIKSSLPLKTFTSYAKVTINYTMEVRARTYEEAEQMFENASQADYTKEEESSHSFIEVEMSEGRA